MADRKRIFTKLSISRHVIYRRLAKDDGIILNLETKHYFSLNESACFILDAIRKGSDFEKILHGMTKKLGATRKEANRDLTSTLKMLHKDRIII